jgi:hypothetical protein
MFRRARDSTDWSFAPARRAASSDCEPRVPTRGATARWRPELVCRQACAGDQPGGHRVRVPHLACLQLVTSPHGSRDGCDEIEQPGGDQRIAREPAGPADRLTQIRYRPITPAAHLVAKHAQPPDVAAADGAGPDHASTRLVSVRRGRDLDRVAIAVEFDRERCVIDVASLSMPARSCDRLEDPAVEADGVTARAKRDPIEIDSCCDEPAGQLHQREATSGRRARHP